jgi:hypothetical protein
VDDGIVSDVEVAAQAEPINLNLQERIHAFGYFILEHTGAKEAHAEVGRQEDSEARRIPAFA